MQLSCVFFLNIGRIFGNIAQDIVLLCREILKIVRGCGIMQFTVVINMRNPNALIAMAFVSQNSNNPYSVFCEYIKYCIFSDTADAMSISDVRTSVSKEFGLYIPYNIAAFLLSRTKA